MAPVLRATGPKDRLTENQTTEERQMPQRIRSREGTRNHQPIAGYAELSTVGVPANEKPE